MTRSRSGSNINSSRTGVDVIALVAIVAFVIVILAFFFTSNPGRGTGVIGVPYAEETSGQTTYVDVQNPSRLDHSPRREDPQPQAVRENGLSEVGNRL